MSILVVGSVAFDAIKTPFGEIDDTLGGSATHFSNAASFFAPVDLVAVVGEDFSPDSLDFLVKRGVNINGLQVAKGKTFRWKGFYEYDLNQAHTLETQLNVFAHFHPDLPKDYLNAELVFLANIDPELQIEVLKQCHKPKLVVSDTMDFWIENKPDTLTELIKMVDIVLMNDSEAREFCSTYSLLEAARKIMTLGPTTVIFKKGEHGALMFTDQSHFAAPAYPLKDIKDPTGAGDSFAGGFMGHLALTGDLTEPNIRKAVIYGSVMASFNVEDFGLKRLMRLTENEIADRYREFRQMTVFEE